MTTKGALHREPAGGTKRVTITDVARSAGVSTSAVSKVLRSAPSPPSPTPMVSHRRTGSRPRPPATSACTSHASAPLPPTSPPRTASSSPSSPSPPPRPPSPATTRWRTATGARPAYWTAASRA
ncbi:LacI family DNA-binding transcriptional regulator [Streptomyces sp. NPDC001848]|uniref:LacI family DNA-binding transcriptional regulator n=1 Tax=Streptomyces sp. NPDC001848 TaxID=3364618 RepID=UPI0036BF9D03